MEKRRLQATGGSSLTLTLPKSWLEQVDLKSKDEVIVNAIGPTLVIKPADRKRQQITLTIKLDDKEPEWVIREMIGAYISGADKITLRAKRITPEQNQTVRRMAGQLFGFEIFEETSEFIVTRSVIDTDLFPVADNTRRVFAICRSMLGDALTAAKAGDVELARDVVQRDQEVNKLVYAIERQFTQVLEGRVEGSAKELKYYSNVAQQLERIGDRAVIIGKLVSDNRAKPVQLSNSFPMIREALEKLLDDVESLLKLPDIKVAHGILDENPRLAPLMYSSHRLKEAYEGAVIEDTFDRSRGRLMNIAELTIDYLMQA